MDRDRVVRILVGILGGHSLGKRREGIRETGILFHFGTLLGFELAFALDILEGLVDIYVTGRLIEQGTSGIELRLHPGEHVVDAWEVVDRLAELGALGGIADRLIVSFLAETRTLGADAEPGPVHQGHDILDQAEPALAAQFRTGVLIGQFAGRGAVDAELVLDMAHVDPALALVIDEHGQAAAVAGPFLAAGKDEMDVRIAVGDETLDTVQEPASFFFAPRGLEHDALEIRSGIWLGQVHGHGLPGADARNEPPALLFGAELIEGIAAALKAPDVLEARIGGRNDLAGHAEYNVRDIQSAVAARHRKAPEAGLAGRLEVLEGLGGVDHASVLEMRPFQVHALGIRGDDVRCDVPGDFQQAAVVLDAILIIDRSFRILLLFGETALLELDDTAHQGMIEMESDFRMVGIVICHDGSSLFAVLFVILDQFRNDFLHRSDDHIIRNPVDRGVGIAVDADDDAALLHTGDVLDLTADSAGDIDLRMDGHTGLADLAVMVAESRIHGGAGGADLGMEHPGEIEKHVEAFPASHSVPAGNDDRCPFEVMLRGFDVVVENLDDIGFRRDILPYLGIDDLPAGLSFIDSLLHDAGTDGRHLGTVLGIDDRRDDIATESGADLVEEIVIGLLRPGIGIGADLQLGTVGSQAARQGRGDPRAEVTADNGRAHQADLRLFLLEQVHKDIRMGCGRIRGQVFPVENEEFVDAVREDLFLHFPPDAGSGDDGMELHAEFGGELAALGQQFLGDLRYGRPLYLAIYKYVVHNPTR